MVEGEIAAIDMVSKLDADTPDGSLGTSAFDEKKALDAKASEYDHFLTERSQMFTTEAIEEAMQKVMDNYAGGISTHYQSTQAACPGKGKDKSSDRADR